MRKWFDWPAKLILTVISLGLLSRWLRRVQSKFHLTNQPSYPADRLQPLRAAGPTPQDYWHPEEQRHRRRERWYWSASVLLTLAAGVGAGFSARYAYKAAQEAHAQVLASQEANRMNNESGRSWISVVSVSLQSPIQEAVGLIIGVGFQNVGKDPALHVKSRLAVQLFPENEISKSGVWNNPNVDICPQVEPDFENHVVFPSGSLGSRNESATITRDHILFWNHSKVAIFPSSVNMADEIIREEYLVTVNGCFTYMASGIRRHTRYCDYLEPISGKPIDQWIFKECANGNEAD